MVHRYIKSMFHKLSNIKKPHIAKKYTKDHMEYPYCVFSLRIDCYHTIISIKYFLINVNDLKSYFNEILQLCHQKYFYPIIIIYSTEFSAHM